MPSVQQNSNAEIRASLRQKIDKNHQIEKKLKFEFLSDILNVKSVTELKQGGMQFHSAFTSAGADATRNVVTYVTPSANRITPVSSTVITTSNTTPTYVSVLMNTSSASSGPNVTDIPGNKDTKPLATFDDQKMMIGDQRAVYYRKLILPTNSLAPPASQNNRISTIPQTIAIPKNPMLVGIDDMQGKS